MAEQNIRILAADGDSNVRGIISLSAQEHGWQADTARDGVAAIKLLRRNRYSLVVLEAELPVIDGRMVAEHIATMARVPIIFISRHAAEEDRLAAFEAGGNDFLTKPFFPRELIARAKNLMALFGVDMREKDELACGGIRIDLPSQTVYVDEKQVRLTPKEYNLLLFFCKNQNQAFSRDTLLDLVWGSQFFGTDRTVDTHVRSLRDKLRPYHNYIATVWGYGYKFEVY